MPSLPPRCIEPLPRDYTKWKTMDFAITRSRWTQIFRRKWVVPYAHQQDKLFSYKYMEIEHTEMCMSSFTQRQTLCRIRKNKKHYQLHNIAKFYIQKLFILHQNLNFSRSNFYSLSRNFQKFYSHRFPGSFPNLYYKTN